MAMTCSAVVGPSNSDGNVTTMVESSARQAICVVRAGNAVRSPAARSALEAGRTRAANAADS
jgi:hypothetical protein